MQLQEAQRLADEIRADDGWQQHGWMLDDIIQPDDALMVAALLHDRVDGYYVRVMRLHPHHPSGLTEFVDLGVYRPWEALARWLAQMPDGSA